MCVCDLLFSNLFWLLFGVGGPVHSCGRFHIAVSTYENGGNCQTEVARLDDEMAPTPERLPKDAPNVLVVLLDDVGFGVADTFGGEVHTPTLSKLARQGIKYNAFHTTSICSPTRAALLTGRNHTRVGSGTIAERAVAFDGYTGVIPKTAATIPAVLKEYGYHTAAFGKWHNTPATETTSIGPKDR